MRSKVLREIVKRTRCTPEYVWRAAKRHDPKLRFMMESLKPAFTDEEMQERVDFCYKMLSEPPEWLRGIVWMDESSVPLSPLPVRVIGRKGEEPLVLDPRTRKDKRQVEYIHYLLSVCWATGLVKLDILSFTDGYDDPVQYQTKEGTDALALTAQEFTARVTGVQDKVRPFMHRHRELFGYKLRYSWDAHSAHKSAEPDIALLPGQFVEPPLHSPDLQKAIETPHAWIHTEFNKRLRADKRVNTVEKALRLLWRVVKHEVTKKKVRKLIESLPATYQSVINNKGGWADRRLR